MLNAAFPSRNRGLMVFMAFAHPYCEQPHLLNHQVLMECPLLIGQSPGTHHGYDGE